MTFIGTGTRLEGELVLESAALVAGELRGRISSSGQIKIESTGVIDGELNCHELRVCGTFRGKLSCQKLIIVSGGVVEGEVASNEMEIFDGGQFLGSRTRGPDVVPFSAEASAALPAEGSFPFKAVAALVLVTALGVAGYTQTGLKQTLASTWQSLTEASTSTVTTGGDNLSAQNSSAGNQSSGNQGAESQGAENQAAASALSGGMNSAADDMGLADANASGNDAAAPADGEFYQEDSEAMDTASALLLQQSPLEENALGQNGTEVAAEPLNGLQAQPQGQSQGQSQDQSQMLSQTESQMSQTAGQAPSAAVADANQADNRR
ncbi:polymer-forming cytoskeletal protein [Shewanella sp. JM162201]|uniref:Polymer-forming cytoskeletal protein n=1 Tax=Shewanella jiangmenensis TaxID=2837387 RepID=A0ABS5V326_9GAMM|nr:polymer-forming cytoskeletal protein [Shewanella jiangmenensis]MBT1444353.1 polymer-forming cytoskeletal protein [Shewanella jiangmenensis]